MIRNNQVWAFRQFYPPKPMHPNPAKKANSKTPDHVNGKTPFSPRGAGKRYKNKGIKEQQSDYEDQPYVKLIT